jgi:hypothetical protein
MTDTGCYCPHALTCEDLNLACEKFPGTEFWPVLFGDGAVILPQQLADSDP